ncbi:hypothetical protein [Oceanobacillus halophilus]|uniref:Uncharacterized protein n=1 Tax=Oceanobacillus halophilus TaxID=930130 RepID=A0A495A497_9BACI|nr:hypothetical protein [Oceanobacillus halophilus]RKQ34566.1 hypothetical protein D8M06_06485 [Oceanobacillus halophilus]
MSHDMVGFNKAGKQIAHLHFSMGNSSAGILYVLLDAMDYHAGVSGTGDSTNLSIEKTEQALNKYQQIYVDGDTSQKDDFTIWEQNEILNFLLNCVTTAQKEGSVRVLFA